MTPYVSIDLETTGLEPSWCQILEFGAVIEDWKSPTDKLPRFHTYLLHDRIVGDPIALAMNAKIIERIAKRTEGYLYLPPEQLGSVFHNWLRDELCEGGQPSSALLPVIAAGKNFGSFDRQFLRALPSFNVPFHHRSIDPGMLYWSPFEDIEPPSTKRCMERARLDGEVAHTAVEDAIGVIKLARRHFEIAA